MARMSDRLTMIDLFAGCGGMTVGFDRGGFTSILAVEWERAAASTYAANFGEARTFWGDIADVPNAKIPPVDVIIGGPPCQGFSNLGSKDVDDPRNKLWKEYLRFVVTARPKVFVLENVERFSRSSEFHMLLAEADHGLIQDYDLSWDVLLAADYGVAQRRPRTIVIGSRVGKIGLPAQTHAKVPNGDFKPGDGTQPDHLLPRCWRGKATGTTDVMGRMRWDAPSLTIRTEFFKPEKGQDLHPQWEKDNPQ